MALKSGSQVFAEAMQAMGVSALFFVPDIVVPALALMEDMGITRVMAHGEKAAAYMADAYARVARRPGLAMAQMIGSANLAAGLKDAYLAGSPVVAITGGRRPEAKHRHVYQELEDHRMFDVVTKFNVQLDVAAQLPDVLRQAFRAATSGAPGPVHIEISGQGGALIEEQADFPDWPDEPFCQVPPFRPSAELPLVRRAARLLEQAQRPIIVAGGGVTASDAAEVLVAVAERGQIPVATSLNAKGSIREDHPLSAGVVGTYSRWSANRAVSEADLVFFVGSHTGSQVTNNYLIPAPGTPVIQLDIDPAELGRVYPNAVSLLGDARAVLQQLLDELGPSQRDSAWTGRVAELTAAWRKENEPLANSDAVPMRPERLCRDVAAALPENAILVADTGHAGIWSATNIELRKPGQRFIRAAGSLGWGFPAALGAKCAAPDSPVVCFTGDGGFYYHIAELETARRYGLPAVIVVNDNQSLNQELVHFTNAYGGHQRGNARQMWTFAPTNFAQVAEAFGCKGLRVENPADLPDALSDALRMNELVVVDAVTDENGLGPTPWRPA